jgi:hypothetical protein
MIKGNIMTNRIEYIKLAHQITNSNIIADVLTVAKALEEYCESKTNIIPTSIVKYSHTFAEFLTLAKIQHPVRGPIHPDYPFFDELGSSFRNNRFTIINKSRQCGITSFTAMYILWKTMFTPNYTVLICTSRYYNAKEIVEQIRYAYENLPENYRLATPIYNKSHIIFENGSQIMGRAISTDAARGLAVSLLYLDELAYLPYSKADEFWASIQPIIDNGGKIIIASTPNYAHGLFYRLWAADNDFKKIALPYTVVPGRDEKWAEPLKASLGQLQFCTEYECMFKEYIAPNPVSI